MLSAYDARSGRFVEQRLLEPDEVLLDADTASGRLLVYRPDRGVRFVDPQSLAEVGELALPTPDTFGRTIIVGDPGPLRPVVHPLTGEIATFHGMIATFHDPDTGRISRRLTVPLPEAEGPVYRADISSDGRLLYLAVADDDLADWEGQPGTVVAALDLSTGAVVERRGKRGLATGWLAWENAVLATFLVHKDIGFRHSLWQDGFERREVFESHVAWQGVDVRRDRLFGLADDRLVLAEAGTLNLRAVVQDVGGAFEAYDPGTDQLYARGPTIDRLGVESATNIHPPPTPSTGRRGATRFDFEPGLGVLRSTDGGATWAPAGDGIDGLYIREVAVSPDFENDSTLFAVSFRGIQSEWTPGAGDSPDPDAAPAEAEPTSHPTTWRSRNGGDDWEPVGRFAAPAFSPDYARDRTVLAFTYLGAQFHVSMDGGDSWEARGRLPRLSKYAYQNDVATRLWVIPTPSGTPSVLLALGNDGTEIGGGPHWPEAGARLFRSVDDGWTWDVAWGDADELYYAWDGVLIGPIRLDGDGAGAPAEGPAWLMDLGGGGTSRGPLILYSDNDGHSWSRVHVRDDPSAYPIAVDAEGGIVIRTWASDMPPRTVTLDALEAGAPPRPTARP